MDVQMHTISFTRKGNNTRFVNAKIHVNFETQFFFRLQTPAMLYWFYYSINMHIVRKW
jgi:hypothetical protein